MAMATAESATVRLIEAKLQELLRRARNVKQSVTVEPALSASEFVPDVVMLGDGVWHSEPQAQKYAILEIAARRIFYGIEVGHFS